MTLEDLLEELVGEIYDESDVAPSEATQVSEDELAVNGTAELRIVEEFFGLGLPGKPTDTVSFWILNRNPSIPKQGAVLGIDGLKVEIAEATLRRIDRVRIRRPPPDSEGGVGRSAEARLPQSNATGEPEA